MASKLWCCLALLLISSSSLAQTPPPVTLSVHGSEYKVHPVIINNVIAGLRGALNKPLPDQSPLRYIDPNFLKLFYEQDQAGLLPKFDDVKQVIPGQAQRGLAGFSLRMLRIFDAAEAKRNIVLSPLSLGITLAFLMQFAEGSTKLEMENVMGMSSAEAKTAFKTIGDNLRITKNEYKISIINMLLISTPSEEVRNVANELLMTITKLERADANTIGKINAYIKNNTYNYITEIIDPESISRFTESFLLNALAFRGFWQSEFLPQNTKRSIFSFDEERTFRGDFMHNKGYYTYKSNNLAKWIVLPMRGGLSMIIILPANRHGLNQLIREMTRDDFLAILQTESSPNVVGVKIPKFEVKYKTMLRNAFDQMRLYGLLSEGIYKIRADGRPVTVGESSHGTGLKIDERGASGSAYTTHQIERLASDVIFAADEPFLAVVVEDLTRMPIIMAKIIDPFPTV